VYFEFLSTLLILLGNTDGMVWYGMVWYGRPISASVAINNSWTNLQIFLKPSTVTKQL
jgi:hypothetical protein